MKPIAYITGYLRGHLTIKTLDPSLVLPPKMALYSYEDVLNAVKAEREACAKFVEGWELELLAEEIRARGEVK